MITKMKFVGLLLYLLFATVLSSEIYAQKTSVKEVQNVRLSCATCYVSNQDGILSESTVAQLNVVLKQVEDSTGAQIAVVVLRAIAEGDARDFSMELYNHWKVGRSGIDDGMIVLLVVDSRDAFLRTGYGLEGVLPDGKCSRIFRDQMVPSFQEGDWDKGMLKGVQEIAQVLLSNFGEDGQFLPAGGDSIGFYYFFTRWLLLSAIWLVISFLILFSFWRKQKSDNREVIYRQFRKVVVPLCVVALFFLPSFPILGIYMWCQSVHIRKKKFKCSRCCNPMKCLSEQTEDKYLDAAEQKEEKLKSKDYDVWLCDNCQHTEIFGYNKLLSPYQNCPFCNNKTMIETSNTVVRMSTPMQEGIRRKTCQCKFCQGVQHKDYRIPRAVGYVGGGGGGSRGGGGSWGGGFSGGGGGGGRF